MKQPQRLGRALLASAVLAAGSAVAGPTPAPVAPSGKGPVEAPKEKDWCSLWDHATLYKSDSNPIIQELALSGRYQGQYALVDSDGGDADGWDHRRFRYGLRGTIFHDFEFKAEALADLNMHDWYEGFTEIYLMWKPNEQFNLTVGKQKPKFSLDFSTSSREILTIERNILLNNLGIDYETGLSVSGKSGKWSYFAGVLNNDVRSNPDADTEFGDLNGGWSWVLNVAYDLKERLSLDKAVLRGDYIHMEHEDEDDLLTRFDDAFAVSFNMKKGQWGAITEFLYASGDDDRPNSGDMWGFYVMPFYDITKKLQVVARYTHGSSGDDALRAQSRYERGTDEIIHNTPYSTDGGYGESYDAGYLGLNYYICGHKLKLMTGLEYANMDGGNDGGDWNGWTWTSAVRVYW